MMSRNKLILLLKDHLSNKKSNKIFKYDWKSTMIFYSDGNSNFFYSQIIVVGGKFATILEDSMMSTLKLVIYNMVAFWHPVSHATRVEALN
jgi:hypothetical protein